MLELNFHSGSSIYSSQWFACLASHTSRSNSHVTDSSYSFPFQVRLTSRSDCYQTGALGDLFLFFFRLAIFMFLPIFLEFIMLFGFMAIYWIYDVVVDF